MTTFFYSFGFSVSEDLPELKNYKKTIPEWRTKNYKKTRENYAKSGPKCGIIFGAIWKSRDANTVVLSWFENRETQAPLFSQW